MTNEGYFQVQLVQDEVPVWTSETGDAGACDVRGNAAGEKGSRGIGVGLTKRWIY